jgi:hypothetical protein
MKRRGVATGRASPVAVKELGSPETVARVVAADLVLLTALVLRVNAVPPAALPGLELATIERVARMGPRAHHRQRCPG